MEQPYLRCLDIVPNKVSISANRAMEVGCHKEKLSPALPASPTTFTCIRAAEQGTQLPVSSRTVCNFSVVVSN